MKEVIMEKIQKNEDMQKQNPNLQGYRSEMKKSRLIWIFCSAEKHPPPRGTLDSDLSR